MVNPDERFARLCRIPNRRLTLELLLDGTWGLEIRRLATKEERAAGSERVLLKRLCFTDEGVGAMHALFSAAAYFRSRQHRNRLLNDNQPED